MTGATATKEKKSKKGFFGRFKKKKESKKASKKDETELPTPPPSPEPQEEAPRQSNKKSKMSVSKTGVPIVTGDNPDDFNPSDVKQTSPNEPAVSSKSMKKSQKKSKKKRGPRDNSVILDKAPTARDSAFSGPPRYDWIDVETAAAIKVQAAYRRNKVMDELEAQGKSTAAMRNRARRRQARRGMQVSDDTPSLFQCCGVGLAFGDGTEEAYEMERQRDKEAYEEKKRAEAEREAELRKYSHKLKNKKPGASMVEAVEVVESDDEA